VSREQRAMHIADRDAALDAMLQAAERHDMPITVQQVIELRNAAADALYPARVRAPQAGWVDAARSTAELRSLIAAGWPLTYLAPRLGATVTELSQRMRRRQVTARTEAETLALVGELRGVDPLAAGVPELACRKARNLAARRGWTSSVIEEGAA